MEIDKTTLTDLSIFNTEEEYSVFSKLNLCTTTSGRERLQYNFAHPLKSRAAIQGVQSTIQFILAHQQHWPQQISNGGLLMIDKFFSATIDEIPAQPSTAGAMAYKLFHGPDFSLVKYSALHCFDFIKGMQQMQETYLRADTPSPLKQLLEQVKKSISKEQFSFLAKHKTIATVGLPEQLSFAHYIRYQYKLHMLELMDIYAQLDAWYGMGQAVITYQLVFPEFIESQAPVMNTVGLYHLLLPTPVSYDVTLDQSGNFLFLTGANMAGKSTFIKSVGTAVFLAHIGMGVPAKQMQLTVFDGLLSNINVVDNLVKGESYFYNEVQRIKATVTKVNDGRKWLILIDELFKGTNVQDAMKCSTEVIEGLLKIKNSLFILSTHLYEIGDSLKHYSNINFKYFETAVVDDQLQFSYHLKEGISNDRLGYLILKKEGVVDLLRKI